MGKLMSSLLLSVFLIIPSYIGIIKSLKKSFFYAKNRITIYYGVVIRI